MAIIARRMTNELFDTHEIATVTTGSPLTTENTTTPWAPVFPSQDKCNYYIVNQTSYHWLDFGNPYGGIPQNLLLNAVSLSEFPTLLYNRLCSDRIHCAVAVVRDLEADCGQLRETRAHQEG